MHVDIAIVGAGFAGLNLAHALSAEDYSVALIDRRDRCPDIFRAEKIEQDQADIMREFNTLQYRQPLTPPIDTVPVFSDGKLTDSDVGEQYGISYADTVNQLMESLPDNIQFIRDGVTAIETGNSHQTVSFANQPPLSSRLVVVATGGGSDILTRQLGIKRRLDNKLKSLNFGFDIARRDGSAFPYTSFNYSTSDPLRKINYITVFGIGERMRVNLFTLLDVKAELSQELRNNPRQALDECFPKLVEYLGDFEIVSKVQVMPTQYYRLKRHHLPGIVVIADEYQSVNPATGSGLSKVLTDIRVLMRHIPAWLASDSIKRKDIVAYYRDQEKIAVDTDSMRSWISFYNAVHQRKITKIHRIWYRLQHYY